MLRKKLVVSLSISAAALGFFSPALLADVVIPSSAFVKGAGGSEFHSDVRVFNPGSSPVNFVPVFYDVSTGTTTTMPTVTIAGRTQIAYDNMLQTVFGKSVGSFGPIRLQTSAPLIVSSGVNNINACQGGGSGQWLPGIDVGQALKAGTLVQLASSVDLTAGYRTNVVFMNPGSATANVTVKVRKGDGSQLSSATLSPLGANGFVQINNYDRLPGVSGTNDTNLWAEFTSDQPVLAFASVINNVSGDPFAIVTTAEPTTPPSLPVASYNVSPASPAVNQAVTFTDTSTGSPTSQFWSFGDGAIATSGATVAHTYTAAGTYKTSHFVTNAAGGSGAVKDVVVTGGAAPQTVNINASQWKFEIQGSPASLKVGTAYQIKFTSTDVVHGVGNDFSHGVSSGLGSLVQIPASCDALQRNGSCTTATFTPTAPGTYYFLCTQPICGAGHDTMKGQITVTN